MRPSAQRGVEGAAPYSRGRDESRPCGIADATNKAPSDEGAGTA